MAIAERTPAPLPGKIAGLLREAKWLLIILVAVYLALMLFTFDRGDPGWSHTATAERIAQRRRARRRLARRRAAVSSSASPPTGGSRCASTPSRGATGGWTAASLSDRRPLSSRSPASASCCSRRSGLEALRFYSLKASLPLAIPAACSAQVAGERRRRDLRLHRRHAAAAHAVRDRRVACSPACPGSPSWSASARALEWPMVHRARPHRAAPRREGRRAPRPRSARRWSRRTASASSRTTSRSASSRRCVEIPKSERVQQGKAGAAVPGPARHAAAAARSARRAGSRTPRR